MDHARPNDGLNMRSSLPIYKLSHKPYGATSKEASKKGRLNAHPLTLGKWFEATLLKVSLGWKQ
jgi:hypothetical protein